MLTETWLNFSFSDNELGLVNYNIYRYDRCSNTSDCLRGGGVLIGIRKDFSSKLITVPDINVEHLFVEFSSGASRFLTCCVYFPPLSPSLLYERFMSNVESVIQQYPNHTFVISGDFNLPEISWSNDSNGLTYTYSSSLRAPCVPEIFAFNGFFQKNSVFNTQGSILDLVFSNSDSVIVNESLEPFVPSDFYHPPLNLSIPEVFSSTKFRTSHSFHNFRKANFNQIISFLSSFDWFSTLSNLDLNAATYTFTDAIHNSILRFVPKSRFYESSFPARVSKELKDLVYRKNKAHALFKSSHDPSHYRAFSLLRAEYKYKSKKCFREFVEHTETHLSNEPNKFWDFVRKNRTQTSIPKSVNLSSVTSTCEKDSVNLFADHFSSAYSSNLIDINLQSLKIPSFDLPKNCVFSPNDVLLKLVALKNVSSCGPDGIPGDFLYKIRQVIFFPLWFLFRRSLNESFFLIFGKSDLSHQF